MLSVRVLYVDYSTANVDGILFVDLSSTALSWETIDRIASSIEHQLSFVRRVDCPLSPKYGRLRICLRPRDVGCNTALPYLTSARKRALDGLLRPTHRRAVQAFARPIYRGGVCTQTDVRFILERGSYFIQADVERCRRDGQDVRLDDGENFWFAMEPVKDDMKGVITEAARNFAARYLDAFLRRDAPITCDDYKLPR